MSCKASSVVGTSKTNGISLSANIRMNQAVVRIVMAKETHSSRGRLVGTMRHGVDLGAAVGTRGRNASKTLNVKPQSPVKMMAEAPVRDDCIVPAPLFNTCNRTHLALSLAFWRFRFVETSLLC